MELPFTEMVTTGRMGGLGEGCWKALLHLKMPINCVNGNVG